MRASAVWPGWAASRSGRSTLQHSHQCVTHHSHQCVLSGEHYQGALLTFLLDSLGIAANSMSDDEVMWLMGL